MGEPLPAFLPFKKCAKIINDPVLYKVNGTGRDYYATHDLYEGGKEVLSRPNTYGFTKYLPKNLTITKIEKPAPRIGRTKFRRYFGNGGGKDGFIIKDNGGNWQYYNPTAMQMAKFKNELRSAPDNTVKEDKLKR